MATKKDIIKELGALSVELEDRDYKHVELADLLKKAQAQAAEQTADDGYKPLPPTIIELGEALRNAANEDLGSDGVPGKDGLDDEGNGIGDVKYAFPTKSRCPRCNGAQTKAVSTQGKIQYRKCSAPICRKAFTVRGTVV